MPFSKRTWTLCSGFTLAELLIALAILGVIATFTIPKILSAQQNGQKQAVTKETLAMIAGAYQQAQHNGIVTTSTSMGDLTQYMNYVAVDTTSTLDTYPTAAVPTLSCSDVGVTCLKLHNGALFAFGPTSFNTPLSYVFGFLDPDGVATSRQDSIYLIQMYNGRTLTGGEVAPSANPSWFSW